MSRYNKHAKDDEDDELLVFGYSSRVYVNDARSELIAGESHLQPWSIDEAVLIDRFDVRLLLSTVPSECKEQVVLSADDEAIERDCDKERWSDLHDAEMAQLKRMEEEESRPKKVEIGFSYDESTPSSSKEEEEDSEDEPFIPPTGIKLPLGLQTPDNQKLNHVIERTALFVVRQGPQMEIVIKAKQRNNQDQFGFLHFDHLLNPYYKYVMKLIREGKYTPDIERKRKKKNTGREEKENGGGKMGERKASANALSALMAEHSESESDSDCELHPSLLAGSRRGGSPDPVENGEKSYAGPQKRPRSPPPIVTRPDYKIETANDAYSTLFKNLAQINVQRDKQKEEQNRLEKEEEGEESEESKKEWEDFTNWFVSFYGMPPPAPFSSMPYMPPPPDMEKTLAGYARYVGENGSEAEFALKRRVELQLHFLNPASAHYLYYLSAVRRSQWAKAKQDEDEAMAQATLPPPPPLNRKQRRMAFTDAPQVTTPTGPSVVDPTTLSLATVAHSYETPLSKSASSPIRSSIYSPAYHSPLPMSPAPPPPISIPPPSLVHGVTHSLSAVPPPCLVQPQLQPGEGITLLPCPVPPSIGAAFVGQIPGGKPNEIMTERQLKARLFMEKILNDKRKKKEEERTKEVEMMEEGEIVESEERDGGKREKRKEKEKETEKKEKVNTTFIDNLIKSKMDALLKEAVPGTIAVERKNEELKEKEQKEKERKGEKKEKERKEEKREKEREERKRKREKKEKDKRRRRRSSSRSSSSDEERRRRRRRSRSKSSDLPSKYRRR